MIEGSASLNRFRKMNRPPEGESWVWFTEQMLSSPAWRAMPLAARHLVERLMLEHLNHAGKKNGQLTCTFDNFVEFGIRRSSVKLLIDISRDLGFIDVTFRGQRSYGISKRPNRYGLTWLPRCDWTPASNRWADVTTEQAAEVSERYRRALRKKSPVTKTDEISPSPDTVTAVDEAA